MQKQPPLAFVLLAAGTLLIGGTVGARTTLETPAPGQKTISDEEHRARMSEMDEAFTDILKYEYFDISPQSEKAAQVLAGHFRGS